MVFKNEFYIYVLINTLAYTEYPEHSMTLNSIASILFIIFENSDNESK